MRKGLAPAILVLTTGMIIIAVLVAFFYNWWLNKSSNLTQNNVTPQQYTPTSLTPPTSQEITSSVDTWIMTSTSNIELLISNSAGQQEGYSPSTKSYVDTLPHASYGLQGGLEDTSGKTPRRPDEIYFELQQPQNGTYYIHVFSKNQGDYAVDVHFDSWVGQAKKSKNVSVTGTLSENQIDKYSVIIPSGIIQKISN